MALLKIKKYPDPILREKSEEVKEITQDIRNLIEGLTETLEKNNGVGISAPQVGVLKRVIVVQTKKGPVSFINPEILKKSKETIIDEEGCLSFLGLYLKIKRAKEIEIEALDREENRIKMKVEGLPARVFQHEVDHLDGILFIDRISFWQKLKIKRKLKQVLR